MTDRLPRGASGKVPVEQGDVPVNFMEGFNILMENASCRTEGSCT